MTIRKASSTTGKNKSVVAAVATPPDLTNAVTAPSITSVSITDFDYNVLDDTAVSTAGGYIKIIGTRFISGCVLYVQGTAAISTTFISSTEVRAQLPATTSGTLHLYLVNPDNTAAIYLTGVTFSGVPAWTTTSPLTTQDSDVAFSIQLVATGDAPVTYQLAAGSSVPSGTTLASNGLFSGTISNLSNETTYSFTVNAIDGQNQDTGRAFQITVRAGDIVYNVTSAHISSVRDIPWISDATTNRANVTVFANTRPVAFSPYETNWSNFFDGTGDYLSIPDNAVFDFGTENYTVEGWMYITGTSRYQIFYHHADNATWSNGVTLATDNGPVFGFWWNNSLQISTPVTLNTWYHVALTRVGNLHTLYMNGVSVGTYSVSATYAPTNNVGIGAQASNGLYPFQGYISNIRVLKGTALYTSNFTPPTTQLTAITNTSLLTCQSNRLRDASTNNFTITRNGDVAVSSFGPFTETDTTTGSGYFDGSGDYLSFPHSTALVYGTGNFTLEFWIYVDAYGSPSRILQKGTGPNDYSMDMSSNGTLTYNNNSGLAGSATTIPVPLKAWTHVALVRTGTGTNQCNWYINGQSAGSWTNSVDVSGTETLIIGGSSGSFSVNGYISNFRLVKGTAVYTSAFTPPTSPLTNITNTSLLTLQSRIGENNAYIVDESTSIHAPNRFGDVTQGTFSPFAQSDGSWSAFFDGTGDYLTWPGTTLSGDFTVECWVYKTAVNASGYTILFGGPGNQQFAIDNSTAGSISLVLTGSGVIGASGTAITPNAWHHLAWVRQGSTCRVYVNGIQRGTGTSSTSFTLSLIGQYDQGGYGLNGSISNVRILNGTCLYPGGTTFTPSTSPLTAITNTALLTCQSNRFVDNSTNAHNITVFGESAVLPSSPFKNTVEWRANTVGGSYYLDGTGDRIVYPTKTDFSLPGDFTMEAWIYPEDLSGNRLIFDTYTAGEAQSYQFYYRSTGTSMALFSTANSVFLQDPSSTRIKSRSWHHVAVTRSGTTARMFVDGTLVANTTYAGSLTHGNPLGVGAQVSTATNHFRGYIAGARINKGTALYTSSFTRPTAPPTPVSGTVVLLNGTSGGLMDYTRDNNYYLFGNTRVTNANTKIGNTSLYFDGSGDYAMSVSNNVVDFAGGNFTIEGWVRPDNVTGTNKTLVASFNYTGSTDIMLQQFQTFIRVWAPGLPPSYLEHSGISGNTWYHVAVTRSGNVFRLFVDGVIRSSNSTSNTNFNNGRVVIGGGVSSLSNNDFFQGYIEDLRITKGVARYTSNFSVPTTPSFIK